MPVECFFSLSNYIYRERYVYMHTDPCGSHNWGRSRMDRPKGYQELSLEIFFEALFSFLFGCIWVTQGDEQRMGTWASLEFIGKLDISACLKSMWFCGYNLAIQGLNFMRNGVFPVTWVHSSAKFNFPELNSRDTSAFLSLIFRNKCLCHFTYISSWPVVAETWKKSAYIREGNTRVHRYLISQSLHPLCRNDEKRERMSSLFIRSILGELNVWRTD